ncbi:hypothetical protein I4U23_014091 [Adineta vaga]|nr:hypothetical protein I4U23_014091 [Adineta vaga]
MSSNIDNNEEHDPIANLNMLPARSILKTTTSIDENRLENNQETTTTYPATGMKRSESKSHKIPHFDEMNIIATYHPIDKDYGHMKIEEPKTPYVANDNIDEEMDTEFHATEIISSGVDPDALADRLNESSCSSSRISPDHTSKTSIHQNPLDLEHRKQFEHQRKEHYNEFEIVRLHKKQIEAELRALEQDEVSESESSSPNNSIKPILVHSPSSSHHHHHPHPHHVHVQDDDQHEIDELSLTSEERERRKQFELKRKQHYNEFHVAHATNKDEDK